METSIGKKRIYSRAFQCPQEVIKWEVISINQEQELVIEFVSTNSKYRQGIRLAIDAGEGYIEVNDRKSREIYLWEDTAPKKIFVKCVSSDGLLSIYNVFDLGEGRGGMRSQTDSCGMLIDSKQNSLFFNCNDAGFDTRFDKLVFRIELL